MRDDDVIKNDLRNARASEAGTMSWSWLKRRQVDRVQSASDGLRSRSLGRELSRWVRCVCGRPRLAESPPPRPPVRLLLPSMEPDMASTLAFSSQ